MFKARPCALRPMLRDTYNADRLRVIDDAVVMGNKLVQHTFLFLRAYFLHSDPPPALNADLVGDVMRVLCESRKASRGHPKPAGEAARGPLRAFHNAWYAPKMRDPGELCSTHIHPLIEHLRQQVLSAYINNITQRFGMHLRRFLDAVMEEALPAALYLEFLPALSALTAAVFERRADLPDAVLEHLPRILPPGPVINGDPKYDLGVRPLEYFRPMVYMARYVCVVADCVREAVSH